MLLEKIEMLLEVCLVGISENTVQILSFTEFR